MAFFRRQQTKQKSINEYTFGESIQCSIEKTNREYVPVKDRFTPMKYFDRFAETERYELYAYLRHSDGTGGYIIARDKSTRDCIFLGKSGRFMSLYHNSLFIADNPVSKTNYSLLELDLSTLQQRKHELFSKNRFDNYSFSPRITEYQDTVQKMYVDEDRLIIEVKRVMFDEKNITDRNAINEGGMYKITVEYSRDQFEFNCDYSGLKQTADDVKKSIVRKLAYRGSLKRDTEIYPELEKYGKITGYISKDYSVETDKNLTDGSTYYCDSVYKALSELYEKENNNILNNLFVLFGWSMYMGCGVKYYSKHKPEMPKEEIAKDIIEARGISELDEYITETIGIPFESEESHEVIGHNQTVVNMTRDALPNNEKYLKWQIDFIAKALFAYGCAMEDHLEEMAESMEQPEEDDIWDMSDKAQPQTKDIVGFYNECVQQFHTAARNRGLANKGVIFIPELMSYGEDIVLRYLQDNYYSSQFADKPEDYYHLMMILSIQAGMLFAMQWHLDYDAVKSGFVEKVYRSNTWSTVQNIFSVDFNMNQNQMNDFFRQMFDIWQDLHAPYWQLADPRDYTFRSLVAAFQLGVSLMLDKLGY